jgi:ketosteroid isomerase-like protein
VDVTGIARPATDAGPAVAPTPADPAKALVVFDRWYVAHESRDIPALEAVLSDDVAVHSLFRTEPTRSREAAVAHFLRTTATFSGLAMELPSSAAAAADGAVLAEILFSGAFTGELTFRDRIHRGAGQRFEVPGVVVVHTRDDEVTVVRTLYDRDAWLRQIDVPCC